MTDDSIDLAVFGDMTPREKIAAFMAEYGVTVEAVFVPFSQSRNKGEKSPSLNWVVTVKRNGRPVLFTDYMSGCGHCPGNKAKMPDDFDRHPRNWTPLVTAWECENGYRATWSRWGGFARWKGGTMTTTKEQGLKPDPCDVLYSLAMDSSVLDAGGFESWAADYGFDSDSRSAEAIYKACLEIALKLRAGIGEAGLAALAEASQDY